jgi:hypothetical protein
VGGLLRPGLQRQGEDALHILIAQLARRAGPLLIEQAVDALVQKAPPPLPNRVQSGRELLDDGGVAQPVGG